MSEIKVNKISPRTNCGTVQLGDSGDTITIPSGATITNNGTASGFGATGSASWNTTVKTGDFTAVAGEGYFVNTTSGEVDVTLPAGTAGDVIAVKDYANTWDTNNCILIADGSEKIGGSTNNATISTEGVAITLVYIDSTQGWLITDDGLQSYAVTNPYMVATGGTITTSGNDKIHTFTGPGDFIVTKAAQSPANRVVSYLVVAGGGGGGEQEGAGGGGAGGVREYKSPVTPYTASPLDGNPGGTQITVSDTTYPVSIGAGGATGPSSGVAVSGSSSIFSSITSAGGGGGGAHNITGAAGGSGGGAGGRCNVAGGAGNTPSVSPAQGQNGGNSKNSPSNPDGGGGGGGATAAGTAGFTSPNPDGGGPGGAGATTSINGSPTAFGGGGGGGKDNDSPNGGDGGAGGAGGGGLGGSVDGSPRCATAGTANTGGGGGGGARSCKPGKSGGSGIVIIRYKFQ